MLSSDYPLVSVSGGEGADTFDVRLILPDAQQFELYHTVGRPVDDEGVASFIHGIAVQDFGPEEGVLPLTLLQEDASIETSLLSQEIDVTENDIDGQTGYFTRLTLSFAATDTTPVFETHFVLRGDQPFDQDDIEITLATLPS